MSKPKRPVATGDPWPPLPYPAGWFCLGLASELKPGTVLTRTFMGSDVVLYRTERGVVRAVEPHCPHLGAHLGSGGRIVGENIQCPFHAFEYDPDGTCVRVPDSEPLKKLSLTQWTIREVNGLLMVWYAPDGAAPYWEIPQVDPQGFHRVQLHSKHVSSHPQELYENTVDYRHFSVVHAVPLEEIAPPETDGPFLRVHTKVPIARIPGVGNIWVGQTVLIAGLGYLVAEIDFPRLGVTVRSWALFTATDVWETDIRLLACCAVAGPLKRVPRPVQALIARLLAKAVVFKIGKVLDEDNVIWKSKRYMHQPHLAQGDKAVGIYRHHVRQFYPSETTGQEVSL
ncbi:Rieske 2Fe-2S domain-containing protein [Streptomyces sp. NPDC050617]|uniref:Rieske 2Fe-2S domain-containing protein n=1 Tax=Streptomyces sp. NPDC050617 TaxID=3154628 RepID=UPI00343DB6E2